MDYGSEHTREVGNQLIQKELQQIPKEQVRKIVMDNLQKIAGGERDFRF